MTRTWNKNTIDLGEYGKKNIVINCDTKEKANDLLEYLDKQDVKWCTGKKLIDHNNWDEEKRLTCYNYDFGALSYADVHWYIDAGYEVIKWEIIDENQQEDNIQKNSIEWDKFVNENVAIHCKSEKETEELLCWILKHNNGILLESPISSFAEGWYSYRDEVCFELDDNRICHAGVNYYNNKSYKILEWDGKNLYNINGTIEVDMDIDTLNDKFIEFIENINGKFGGGIK